MAKENFVFLSGQVLFSPKIYVGKSGEPIKATLLLKTIRRHYLRTNLRSVSNGTMFDIIPIATFNAEIIKTCMDIHQHDMIELRGVYTTKENTKKHYCKKCGELIENAGVNTFVTPIYLRISDRVRCDTVPDGFDPDMGVEMLKRRAEISNTVKLIGTLCRNPEKIMNVKQASAQYQVASNRRFRIREDDPEARTDYPWIKTYGPQAEADFEALHVGSVIYVDGCFQSRQITRRIVCKSCGCDNSIEDMAYEIVPYSVEYLSNCNLPDSEKDTNNST